MRHLGLKQKWQTSVARDEHLRWQKTFSDRELQKLEMCSQSLVPHPKVPVGDLSAGRAFGNTGTPRNSGTTGLLELVL